MSTADNTPKQETDTEFNAKTEFLEQMVKGGLARMGFSMGTLLGRSFSSRGTDSTTLRRMMALDKLTTRDVLRLIGRTQYEVDPAVVRSWIKYASPERHLEPYCPTVISAIISGRHFEARERKAINKEFTADIVKQGANADVVEVAKAICRRVEDVAPMGYTPPEATAFLFELNMALIPLIVTENDPKAFDAVLQDLTDLLSMKFHKRPDDTKLN